VFAGILLFLRAFRCKNHYHVSPFEPRFLIDFRNVRKSGSQPLKDILPMLLVRYFTAFENDNRLHFIAVLKKLAGVPGLKIEIMYIGIGMETEFFHQCDMLMFPLEFLLFTYLVLEFAEIHNLADWRIGIGNYLYQIPPSIASHLQRFARSHNPKLTFFVINYADFHRTNFFIDAYTLVVFSNSPISYNVSIF
jgi:hypothetical protein